MELHCGILVLRLCFHATIEDPDQGPCEDAVVDQRVSPVMMTLAVVPKIIDIEKQGKIIKERQ